MSIKIRCPGCRQKIRYSKAPEAGLGRCPRCGTVVLTMGDETDDEAGPAASHGAIVPGSHRRETSPADETAVFRPLFPQRAAVTPPPPAFTAQPPRRPVRLPARRAILSRRVIFGFPVSAGASLHSVPCGGSGPGGLVEILFILGVAGLSMLGLLTLIPVLYCVVGHMA